MYLCARKIHKETLLILNVYFGIIIFYYKQLKTNIHFSIYDRYLMSGIDDR